MKISATNGNARNGIKGQRVTMVSRCRTVGALLQLPAGGALKRRSYWPRLEHAAEEVYRLEAQRRAGVQSSPMIDLFARSKARLSIRYGRKFP